MKKLVTAVVGILAGMITVTDAALADEASNYELSERIKQIEEKLEGGILPEAWANRITLSGVIEVEAGYEEIDFADPAAADEETSDFALATVEVGIDVRIAKHVSGHVLFLYEDGEDILVDEGYILLDGEDVLPMFLKAGEMYVPFGKFESHMISDPLTLELAETRETALGLGFRYAGFYGSVYAFNGDVDKADDDSHVDNFGAVAGYAVEKENFTLDVGVCWINHIADSDGSEDILSEEESAAAELGVAFAFDDYVPGFGAYAVLSAGPVSLFAEYIAALDEPEWRVSDLVPGSMAALGLSPVEKGEKVAAWNVELGYTCQLAGKETTFAAAVQGTEDMEEFLPEERYLGSVGVGIFENTTLALEYFHDEFENGDEADVITAQLAIAF